MLFVGSSLKYRTSAVGMWESRVLREISKSLWKPFCGFQGDVISIVAITAVMDWRPDRWGESRGRCAVTSIRSAETSAGQGEPRMVYFVRIVERKSVWSFVRQLRGPHLRTCAWWRRRSRSAVTAAVSPSSFPQSSTGLFEVSRVDARS